jgi:hypothetical protein
MRKLCRGISLISGLCFIMAALSSESFIITHGDHDCPGDGCPVCAQIQGGAGFSGNLRSAGYYPLPAPRVFSAEPVVSKNPVCGRAPISPVLQKIKMNL